MQTVLIGAGGQLATALLEFLPDQTRALPHTALSIEHEDSVQTVLDRLDPQLVINASAYNYVDRAEQEPEIAFRVNAFGPRNLALWCARRGAVLVHVSTDYVFGMDAGRQIPYSPQDAPGPLSAYGVSKLAGEYFVRNLCPRHYVVRTCGLYGPRRPESLSRGKGNFVETMLKLASIRDEVRVVNDQRNTPSYAADIARAIAALLPTEQYGLYHATNSGDCTWYEFAAAIFELAGLPVRAVPITSAEFSARAARPAYSVLNGESLAAVTGLTLPHWKDALARYLQVRETPGDSRPV